MRKKIVKKLLILSCLTIITACDSTRNSYYEQLFVFGTIVEIELPNGKSIKAEQALKRIHQDFNHLHRILHPWQPSELTALNQALQQGNPFVASADLLSLLKQAKTISQLSEGYFNPAIGNLIKLWGFYTDDYPIKHPPPTTNEIAALIKSAPKMDNIFINQQKISVTNSNIAIDLNAIAKGYAVDKAIGILKQVGIKSALVNAGGDLRAYGKKHGNPWIIAIKNPFEQTIIAKVMIENDESIMTSGSYYRYKEFESERYPHIIDPFTGNAVRHTVSVTVITKADGVLADAAATALTVAGPKDWKRVANKLDINYVLLIESDGTVHMTKEMLKRMQTTTKMLE